MNIRWLFIYVVALAAAPGSLRAQPGYGRPWGEPVRSEAKETPQAPKPSKAKEKDVPKAGADKESIEAYLKSRLDLLEQFHKDQESFGRRMGNAWKQFWKQVYEDRKLFEVRLARQRLNLFESLASLDPASHRQTVADFDRLQATQFKSFETELKARMDHYFNQLAADLKDYAAKQEKQRAAFLVEAEEAWKKQRGNR